MITQALGNTINERMLAGRVARIIAKHKAYICLPRKCYPNIKKSNKCVNDREARATNHCQAQKIHKFTRQICPNLKTKNQLANARRARGENHCQTKGIHGLLRKPKQKP